MMGLSAHHVLVRPLITCYWLPATQNVRKEIIRGTKTLPRKTRSISSLILEYFWLYTFYTAYTINLATKGKQHIEFSAIMNSAVNIYLMLILGVDYKEVNTTMVYYSNCNALQPIVPCNNRQFTSIDPTQPMSAIQLLDPTQPVG